MIWSRPEGGAKAMGSVDIREIKELRPGKQSREFQKWNDEAKHSDDELCFSIFYGSEFRLKSISLILFHKSTDGKAPDAKAKSEVRNWIDGECGRLFL